MKKFRLLTLLALLMTAVTGAWAQTETYSVKFEANGNSKTIENVTLPYTFLCDWNNENGELDVIIKELYGLSGGYCNGNATPSASGNSNVTAGLDGWCHYITISAPFEGTATVTGVYELGGGATMNYELTISIPAPTYTVDLKANTDDAGNWTGKAGSATTFSALPLENVAPGDAVTLKYSGNRKVKTVTATLLQMQSLTIAKGSSGLSGDKVLYYMPGDTYLQALARTENQSTGGLGWGYYPDSNFTTLYFKEVTTKAWDVAIDGDSNFAPGKGSCDITLDTEINPTGHTFQFVTTQK